MKNKLLIIGIILVTCAQGIIFLNSRENKKESKSIINIVEAKDIYIKDIDIYLSYLKNCNVVNRTRDDEAWIVDVNITGTRDELLSDLNLLNNFNIISYNIAFNNNKGDMNLELKSR